MLVGFTIGNGGVFFPLYKYFYALRLSESGADRVFLPVSFIADILLSNKEGERQNFGAFPVVCLFTSSKFD